MNSGVVAYRRNPVNLGVCPIEENKLRVTRGVKPLAQAPCWKSWPAFAIPTATAPGTSSRTSPPYKIAGEVGAPDTADREGSPAHFAQEVAD